MSYPQDHNHILQKKGQIPTDFPTKIFRRKFQTEKYKFPRDSVLKNLINHFPKDIIIRRKILIFSEGFIPRKIFPRRRFFPSENLKNIILLRLIFLNRFSDG